MGKQPFPSIEARMRYMNSFFGFFFRFYSAAAAAANALVLVQGADTSLLYKFNIQMSSYLPIGQEELVSCSSEYSTR
jgi:hypothetical protein